MMGAIIRTSDGRIQVTDSTSVRAHQQAVTAKGIGIIGSVGPETGSQPCGRRGTTAFDPAQALLLAGHAIGLLPTSRAITLVGMRSFGR